MNENQYKYQYLLSLQNVFTGIGIALARCAFNSVMFSAGRSDFFKSLGGVGNFRLGFRLPAHRRHNRQRKI